MPQGIKTKNGHKPTSEFVGVSWHEGCARCGHSGWRMDIAKDNTKYYQQFGPSDDDELWAALAYNGKAIELYGEKARLN